MPYTHGSPTLAQIITDKACHCEPAAMAHRFAVIFALLGIIIGYSTQFNGRISFIDLIRLDVIQLTDRLVKHSVHTIILCLAYYKTSGGTFLAVSDSASLVLKHSERPVYSLWERTLEKGIVNENSAQRRRILLNRSAGAEGQRCYEPVMKET